MKTTFIKELKAYALAHNIHPSKVIEEAGFSSGNWYLWKKGKGPSDEMETEIRNHMTTVKKPAVTAQKEEVKKAGEAWTDKHGWTVLREEKLAERQKLDNTIGALEVLIANA
jgi:hypothetical protein